MTRKKQAPNKPDITKPEEGLHPVQSPFAYSPGHQEPHDLEPTAPVTPSPHLLNPSHQRFAQEYIKDLDATKAYQRTYPDCLTTSAGANGYKLLKNAQIRGEIQRLMDERAAVTGITADRVLLRLWEQATFDPRQLVEVIVGCCRHCWGLYHQYQYTEAEFERAQHKHVQEEAKRRKAEKDDYVPKAMPEKGGTGFDAKREPNPECPECHGDGHPRTILKDTRRLTDAQSAMFAGVKHDSNGNVQVLIRDQHPALLAVAKHLGMLNDKLPGPALEADPLALLLEQLRGPSGTQAALPVVAEDPERRPRAPVQDVQDVQAKTAPGAVPPKKKSAWKPA